MKKKILVTGGAVHAKMDAIKRLTNDFKGGLMVDLAYELWDCGYEIIYLTAKGCKVPMPRCACGKCRDESLGSCGPVDKCKIIYHDGFNDYREKVNEIAKTVDGIILGGAVANVIPL